MREIKFRAWHKDRKKMYRFDEIFYCDEYNCMSWKLKDEDRDSDGGDYSNLLASTDDFELMQFTGLLDKNVKEIYEGDIVSWDAPPGPKIKQLVVFDGDRWSVNESFSCDCEVIGNVHDNPELLEKNS